MKGRCISQHIYVNNYKIVQLRNKSLHKVVNIGRIYKHRALQSEGVFRDRVLGCLELGPIKWL